MAYERSSLQAMIQEDHEKMEGHRDTVKASMFEKMGVKKVKMSELHVNPDDEFTFPDIGPNDAIVENYSKIARRQYALALPVYEEPIQVNKLREGGYLILNGHHRWAGAIRACVPNIRIKVTDP